MKKRAKILLASLTWLSGCGGGGNAGYSISSVDPGPSPFVSIVHVSGDMRNIGTIEYTIAPKPGSVSSPVHVSYSPGALVKGGYLSSQEISVPVLGLYAGYANQVSITLNDASDSRISTLPVEISTPPYSDPTGIYGNPTILVPRAAGRPLGFDFIYMKSALGSPVIVDTDGEIRWVVPGMSDSVSSAFYGSEFVVGDASHPIIYHIQPDGTITNFDLPGPYTLFHHDLSAGKYGLLAEVNAGIESIATILIEMTPDGRILNHWDLAAILSAYMTSQGDDPTLFVRPGTDWFHMNSAIYDWSDDTVIVSSRENFVIKLDYSTGKIIWIFGDPTKYWYTFPSLRAKALTLAPGGLYPIGQHGLSITSDGLLMLANDGLDSQNQPTGAPAGENRSYSAVSAYSIRDSDMTAQQVWEFDANQTIYSDICSSAYESDDNSVLVDFSTADDRTQAILFGLDANHNVAFELQYASASCDTAWNARPFRFEDLVLH